MSKQAQPTARKVTASVVLAPVSVDMAKASARLYAAAAAKHAKADDDFMSAVVKSVAGLPPLNAVQWDKQLRKHVKAALAAKRDLAASSVGQYVSNAKVLQLGALHGLPPIAGEGRKAAISRISEALATLKVEGVHVWPATAKAGRPKAAKGSQPGVSHGAFDPSAAAILRAGGLSSSDSTEDGFNRSPVMAAALILAKGNEARAQRLAFIVANHPEAFDKWAEGFLTTEDKAAIAVRSKAQAESDKGKSDVVTLKPGETSTAMGSALIEAQRKLNNPKPKAARKAA